MLRFVPALLLAVCLMPTANRAALAQTAGSGDVNNLSDVFASVFTDLLTERFSLSPGPHAQHYFPAADLAAGTLAPTLNTLIASNVSSFPLSSTVAGVTFDFSTGQPVQVLESPGPIFAETAPTLGKNTMTFGVNATHLSLNSFRSMSLSDMEFAFFHEDLDGAGRGDNLSELDVVFVRPNLELTSNIVAFFGSYGVTQNLDVGVAIPFISINVEGVAEARIDSYTLTALGIALHYFGGDRETPVLEDAIPYRQQATGIGDVAVRAKYRFPIEAGVDLASLVDVRLPTGSEDNFLGTGALNGRLTLIGSKRMGLFTPHLNLGYNYRGADLDSDELEFAVGFDQQMAEGLSFAVDLLGDVDLNSFEAIRLLPGTETLTFTNETTGVVFTEQVPYTNIPDRENDHLLMASVGARWAPTMRFQVMGNVLVPLLQTGLRSSVIPTIGGVVIL